MFSLDELLAGGAHCLLETDCFNAFSLKSKVVHYQSFRSGCSCVEGITFHNHFKTVVLKSGREDGR